MLNQVGKSSRLSDLPEFSISDFVTETRKDTVWLKGKGKTLFNV
jgi:hypothetical protein